MAVEMENVFSIFRGPNGTIFAIIFATLIVLLTIGMYFKFMDSCNLFYYKKKNPSVKFVQKIYWSIQY